MSRYVPFKDQMTLETLFSAYRSCPNRKFSAAQGWSSYAFLCFGVLLTLPLSDMFGGWLKIVLCSTSRVKLALSTRVSSSYLCL